MTQGASTSNRILVPRPKHTLMEARTALGRSRHSVLCRFDTSIGHDGVAGAGISNRAVVLCAKQTLLDVRGRRL